VASCWCGEQIVSARVVVPTTVNVVIDAPGYSCSNGHERLTGRMNDIISKMLDSAGAELATK
jgi:hypothetical protein